MQRLLLFPCILVLAAFAGCSQPTSGPISQQPVVNIDDYFWKIGQAAILFADSTDSVAYTLLFAATHDTLTVRDGTADTFQCIINQDSIYAFDYGLARSKLFGAVNDDKFYEGLVLLRSDPFGNDSSWVAGTLWVKSSHPYTLIARALAHFDTLQIVDSLGAGDHVINKYPDVLMVRYEYEGSATTYSSQDTIPYWVIYFAKNLGPVMVDKVTVTGLGTSSQKMALDRHKIKQ
jgi:hypothetical protein